MRPCRKVHPDVANSRASFVRALIRCTEKRTTTEQPGHDGESRSGKKPRTRHERSDTHRHFVAGGALCRRGVYERQEKKEYGKRVREQKNPSQLEVVRDGRRVTDGIRTHDIQNHNLTL